MWDKNYGHPLIFYSQSDTTQKDFLCEGLCNWAAFQVKAYKTVCHCLRRKYFLILNVVAENAFLGIFTFSFAPENTAGAVTYIHQKDFLYFASRLNPLSHHALEQWEQSFNPDTLFSPYPLTPSNTLHARPFYTKRAPFIKKWTLHQRHPCSCTHFKCEKQCEVQSCLTLSVGYRNNGSGETRQIVIFTRGQGSSLCRAQKGPFPASDVLCYEYVCITVELKPTFLSGRSFNFSLQLPFMVPEKQVGHFRPLVMTFTIFISFFNLRRFRHLEIASCNQRLSKMHTKE